MITRCPCCGASNSLDSLVQSEAALEAIQLITKIDQTLASDLLIYAGLHRPAKYALSFDRLGKLLLELVPDIQRQQITHDGQNYPAPLAAWRWAIAETLRVRDEGRLKLPLKGHGWLYNIIREYKPVQSPLQAPEPNHQSAMPVKPALPTLKQHWKLG